MGNSVTNIAVAANEPIGESVGSSGADDQVVGRDSGPCCCLKLRQAARAITQMYDEALRPTGLRATQLAVLAAAQGSPCITLCRLADLLIVDRTTLTRNLQPLEKRGLIRVDTGQDRRARSVCITEAGSRALAEAKPAWDELQSMVIEKLGGDRLTRLISDLDETVRIAQKQS